MAFLRIEDFDPHYKDAFDGEEIIGLDVYSDVQEEKIGSITDILVDESGHFRYFVVDLGFWIFGKTILLPVGRSRIDYQSQRVYTNGLTKEQATHLPSYQHLETKGYDYEEQVRTTYRLPYMGEVPIRSDQEYIMPNTSEIQSAPVLDWKTINPDHYSYDLEPSLYRLNERDHQQLKRYEERLIAHNSLNKSHSIIR